MCEYNDEYESRLTFLECHFQGAFGPQPRQGPAVPAEHYPGRCRARSESRSGGGGGGGAGLVHDGRRETGQSCVREVVMIHVGGTRCVTSSTGNNMKRPARITLTVEFIRTCLFVFLLYV